MTIVLASSSPRRRELLGRFGLPFSIVPSVVPERPPEALEDPASYAVSVAREKAQDVSSRHSDAVVLAADTVVFIDGTILGKPKDRFDASRMLSLLAGREHHVLTGVVARCGGVEYAETQAAIVSMRRITDEEITEYVASGEPMDKAGAYAVQGLAGRFVESVTGCYWTVVGLPLCLTARFLDACGALDSVPPSARCVHRPSGSVILEARTTT